MPKDIEALTGTDLSDFKAALAAYLWVPRYVVGLHLSANQSIASGGAIVSWSSEETDPDGLVTVPATFVTIPSGVTYAQVRGMAAWANNVTNDRIIQVREKNTSDVLVQYLAENVSEPAGNNQTSMLFGTPGWRPVTAGNRIDVFAYQVSGSAINLLGGAASTSPFRTSVWLEFR